MSVSAPRVLVVVAFGLAIALVAVTVPAATQAEVHFVDSNVTADTTWSAEEGPYRVVGNVTIASNATLSIESGTTVQFAEGVTMGVAGTLQANGTAAEPVQLTASRALQQPGAWGGIRTVGTDHVEVSLTRTEVAYATTAIEVRNPDSRVKLAQTNLTQLATNGIDVTRAGGGTAVTVHESTMQDVGGIGVTAARTELVPVERGGNWAITASRFEDMKTGIDLDAERVSGLSVWNNRFDTIESAAVRIDTERIRQSTIGANTIAGGTHGVAVETADVSSLSIRANDMQQLATGIDIHLEQNAHALEIADNRIDRGATGVSVTHDSRGDSFYDFDLSVTDNEITSQSADGLALQTSMFSDSEFELRNNTLSENGEDGAHLDVGAFQDAVIADNRMAGNGRTGLWMAARHVRNTDLARNVIRENGRSGIEITADAAMERLTIRENDLLDNAREGLSVQNGEQSRENYTITDNVIAANAYGVALAGPQTGILAGNAIVYNTVAFGDRDVRLDAGSGVGVLVTDGADDIKLASNDVYGHRIGLLTRSDGIVAAEDNYWGDESGPYHRSINPEGEGNAVATEVGWVELVEVRSERIGPAYARPTAALSLVPHPAEIAEPVSISAAHSVDPDGTVSTYRFTVGDRTTVSRLPQRTTTFETNGTYRVRVWVEDDMGIESAEPATAALEVITPQEPTPTPEPTTLEPTTEEPQRTTATQGTTPATTSQPTTAVPTSEESTTVATTTPPDEPGPGLVGWLVALLGAVFYGTAVIFGGRGMYQTFKEAPLTVRGRRVHVLAAVGVLIWTGGWLLGPEMLGLVAAVGAVAWVLLTAAAFLMVRYT